MTIVKSLVWATAILMLAALAPAYAAHDSDDGIYDLPSRLPPRAIAIIYSGDGGWQDLDKTIGEWMVEQDIHVIGVSTIKVFWDTREPEQVAADIESMLARADPTGTLPVMLIGYSFGADILPFAWPKLNAETQERVRLIALLAPSTDTEFHVSVEGWLGLDTGSHSVIDALKTLPADRTICVYGEEEADSSGCTAVPLPGVTLVHTSGGHHFDEDYPKLGQRILNAFATREMQADSAAPE